MAQDYGAQMNVHRLGALFMAATFLSGCAMFHYATVGQPDIDDTVWLPPGNGQGNTSPGPKFGDPDSSYLPPACAATGADTLQVAAPPASNAGAGGATRQIDVNAARPAATSTPAADEQLTSDPYNGWTGARIVACTEAMRQLIDIRFAHYEDAVLASDSTWNTFSDIAVVGMGAAGSLAGGTTSQVLNAASSALTGTQGKINSDVLYSHSINLILQQMKTNRAQQGTIIDQRLAKTNDSGNSGDGQAGVAADPKKGGNQSGQSADVKPYANMYEAAVDLYAYARAGSWTEAMISLEGTTGSKAQQCSSDEQTARLTGTQPKTQGAASNTGSTSCTPTQ